MPCGCRDALLDAAHELLVDADRARRDGYRKGNARFIETRALGYAAAAGHLTRHKDKPMTDTLTTVTPEIDRDRYGRPMIVPPGGGKKVAYRRATTFVGCLEDTFNLSRWQQRNVAVGLADRPDLLLSVAAHRDDKAKLNQLCEDAAEAAKAHAAATTGTAVHALTEIVDRGLDLPILPESALADVAAYRLATAGIEWLAIERGIVVDDLTVHGTPDRIGRLPDGRVVVLDLKTGSVEYGMGKIAMQLAMYAHGQFYDHVTGTRHEMPMVDLNTAIVIHLPAGSGTCELLEVDIEAGWEGVTVASQVWGWRSRKGLSRPFVAVDTNLPAAPSLDLAAQINVAETPERLADLWATHQDAWLPEHTELARTRKSSLAATAA